VSYDTPGRVELGGEDRGRVRRLTEEVQGRPEEISLIAARALGLRLEDGAVRKFVPREAQAGPARVRGRGNGAPTTRVGASRAARSSSALASAG
jgi:hypothetical protein